MGAYRPTVANRPPHDTPRITTSTDLQWEDLGRIQPGDDKPSRAENDGIQEDEEGGCTSDVLARTSAGIHRSAGKSTCDEHANTLADSTPI